MAYNILYVFGPLARHHCSTLRLCITRLSFEHTTSSLVLGESAVWNGVASAPLVHATSVVAPELGKRVARASGRLFGIDSIHVRLSGIVRARAVALRGNIGCQGSCVRLPGCKSKCVSARSQKDTFSWMERVCQRECVSCA